MERDLAGAVGDVQPCLQAGQVALACSVDDHRVSQVLEHAVDVLHYRVGPYGLPDFRDFGLEVRRWFGTPGNSFVTFHKCPGQARFDILEDSFLHNFQFMLIFCCIFHKYSIYLGR